MNYIAKPLAIAAFFLASAGAVSRAIPVTQTASGPSSKPARARVAVSQVLPAMNGRALRAIIVEVNYGPGEFSLPHTHPCPVIGYVLEGSVRSQVKGEPEATYQAGDTFYEPPNGIHEVSANASGDKPAKFLAFFVCDTDAPLSSPVPADKSLEGNKP